jgi:hypothetical protein
MCVQMMLVGNQCFSLFTAQLAATTKRASGTRKKQQKHKQLQQQLQNAERELTSLVVGRRCCVSYGMLSTCPCGAARIFTRSPGYRDSVKFRISGDSISDTCIHVMLRFARLRPCSLFQMRFDAAKSAPFSTLSRYAQAVPYQDAPSRRCFQQTTVNRNSNL